MKNQQYREMHSETDSAGQGIFTLCLSKSALSRDEVRDIDPLGAPTSSPAHFRIDLSVNSKSVAGGTSALMLRLTCRGRFGIHLEEIIDEDIRLNPISPAYAFTLRSDCV